MRIGKLFSFLSFQLWRCWTTFVSCLSSSCHILRERWRTCRQWRRKRQWRIGEFFCPFPFFERKVLKIRQLRQFQSGKNCTLAAATDRTAVANLERKIGGGFVKKSQAIIILFPTWAARAAARILKGSAHLAHLFLAQPHKSV
jgi:hypothetical protein